MDRYLWKFTPHIKGIEPTFKQALARLTYHTGEEYNFYGDENSMVFMPPDCHTPGFRSPTIRKLKEGEKP